MPESKRRLADPSRFSSHNKIVVRRDGLDRAAHVLRAVVAEAGRAIKLSSQWHPAARTAVPARRESEPAVQLPGVNSSLSRFRSSPIKKSKTANQRSFKRPDAESESDHRDQAGDTDGQPNSSFPAPAITRADRNNRKDNENAEGRDVDPAHWIASHGQAKDGSTKRASTKSWPAMVEPRRVVSDGCSPRPCP